MPNKNPIQQRIEEERAKSPAKDKTAQAIAVTVSNTATKTGISTPSNSKSWQKGNEPWNKGKNIGKESWGKTRRERANSMSDSERRDYFGMIDQHTEETKQKMSESAKQRWKKKRPSVITPDGTFSDVYAAANHYGVHADTVRYRVNNKSDRWSDWQWGPIIDD